jgi:PAS domain-containing protein
MPNIYVSRLKDFIDRRTTPPGLTTDDGIRYWQERLLMVFVFVGAVFGIFVYLPSVALSIKEDLWSVAVADTIIYAWVVILFFSRSIPFAVRAASISLIGYILGMLLLLTIGPFGGGPVWLFTFPVIVAILLGLRISLIALAVNAVTLIIIGILLQFGYVDWDYSTINPVEKWIVISLNFLLLNSVVTISIALISGGIQDLLKRQKSMLASLEKSEEKFRVLFEFAPDAYYLSNLEGTLIDGNRTAEELLGYKKGSLRISQRQTEVFCNYGALPPRGHLRFLKRPSGNMG